MSNTNLITQQLVEICAELLVKPKEQIDTSMVIQNLGFNSILLVKFMDNVSEKLDDDIHPGVMFEYDTLDAFAEYLEEFKGDKVAAYLASLGSSLQNDEQVAGSQTTSHDDLNNLPVIIGGGIAGLLISYQLSEQGIEHLVVGKAIIDDKPRLGESMTESVSIEFTRTFKKFAKYFHLKKSTPFYMGEIVAGLNFDFFNTMAALFTDEDKPNTFIHVDRIGFDRSLYNEVVASRHCQWIEEFVSDVEYCTDSDKVKAITLAEGTRIEPSFVWDCTNHVRLLGETIGIPYKKFDAPREVFFNHYYRVDKMNPSEINDFPWLHSTSLLRADQTLDGFAGISWLIPLGEYVSVGVSVSAEDVGDRSSQEVMDLLIAAYKRRGLDLLAKFPQDKKLVRVPSQHFMYDRFVGCNWALVGGSGSSTWFTSGSNVSIIANMAGMADKIIVDTKTYGEHYTRHVIGFTKTQTIYDNLLSSALGPLDATKFLYSVVEQSRKRISSFFMYRHGLDTDTAKLAGSLWNEEVIVDKTYFNFLRQIATHVETSDYAQQTRMIFEQLNGLRAQNMEVRVPYLRDNMVREERPELFL